MAKYSLALLKGFNAIATFEVPVGITLIGRGVAPEEIENFINLEPYDQDLKVSKEHAILNSDELGVSIEDLGSTNGTVFNCTEELGPGEARYLKHGDQILLGKLMLEFRVED